MATELGKAYVQIVPSARGLSNAVSKELNPEISKITSSLAKPKGLASSMRNVGSVMTKYVTKPALAAGAALSGLVVGSGFKRLMSIDTARAQLLGLGHDASTVDAIMANALASVKGTAFGMGEAATTAATAVAAGIKPGQELEHYLSLVADAASIAGVSMGEMGSVFNRIATSGVVQAQELNMMLDRGIPIIQMLADTMGVSEDKIRSLASEGEISAQDFYNAIESGMGGAAKTIGEFSTAAAWENLKAALGRLGASFLGAGDGASGFFDALKPLMARLTEWVDTLAPIAEEWGKKLKEAFDKLIDKVSNLVEWWKSLSPGMQDFIAKAGLVVVALGPLMTGFSKLITFKSNLASLFTCLVNPMNLLKLGLAGLAAGLIYLVVTNEDVRNAIISVWNGIKEFFGQTIPAIFEGIVGWFSQLPEKIGGFFMAIYEHISTWATNVWNKAIEVGTNFITSIVDWFSQLPSAIGEFCTNAFNQVISWGTNMISRAIDTGRDFLAGIAEWFSQLPYNLGLFIGEALGTVAKWSVDMVTSALQLGEMFLKSIITWFSQLPQKLANYWQTIISSTKAWVVGMIESAKILGSNFIKAIVGFFKELPKNLLSIFKAALSATSNWISGMISEAVRVGQSFLQSVISFIRNLPGQMWEIFTTSLSKVMSWGLDLLRAGASAAKSLVTSVWEGIKSLPRNMVDMGKQVVQGFWEGIKSLGSWLAKQVSNFFKGIIDGVKRAFGIHSPSKVFAWIGEMNIAGFAEGIKDNTKLVSAAMDTIESEATRSMESDFGMHVAMTQSQIRRSTGEGLAGNSSTELGQITSLLDALKSLQVRGDITLDGSALVGALIGRIDEALAQKSSSDAIGGGQIALLA